MDGDQFGTVGEGGFNLNVVDHLGDTVHDLVAADDRCSVAHQIGDRGAVTRAFDDKVADQRDGLRVVEFNAPFKPSTRHHGRRRHQ